jgi:hypothetical protein
MAWKNSFICFRVIFIDLKEYYKKNYTQFKKVNEIKRWFNRINIIIVLTARRLASKQQTLFLGLND